MVILAVGMLLLGLFAGWLVWGSSPPDPIEALQPTRDALRSAAEKVDVVVAHAEFAKEAGERTPAYAGSAEAITQARQSFDAARSVLGELSPDSIEQIDAGLEDVAELVSSSAPPDQVISAATELADQLRSALG